MASLNSGIGVSQIIIDSLADDSINAMEVKISHESFVLGKTSNVEKRWSSLVKEIQSWLSPNEPSFILLKSGHPNTSFKWTLIQFIPDTSSVREKMIYSSSKALLVKELHQNQKYIFQIFATQVKEVTSAGLDEFAASSEAPNPLSDKEKEKQIHQYEEASVAIGLSTRATNASQLQFEITSKAKDALKASLVTSGVVGLGIQDEKTVLIVEECLLEKMSDLTSICPSDAALFVFFKLETKEDIGFCYVSPPSCKIKDRMLFAASRQTLLIQVETLLLTSIKKKYEVDHIEQVLSEDYDTERTLASQSSLGSTSKLLFSKPKRPGK